MNISRAAHYSLVSLFSLFTLLMIDVLPTLAAPPALLFSDLEWGPKTGWEGAATRGAAVTIWGTNFGVNRGSSYVAVNGSSLTNDSDYAEWGARGPARGLERITFWLKSTCQDGAGTISVSVNGQTSNTLPFTVRPAKIYFIAVSNGNNSYNGQYASPQGGSNGPWKDIYKFGPDANPSGDTEPYIVYARGGIYTQDDPDPSYSCMVCLRGPYGSSNTPKAIIAYPGETPILDVSRLQRGGFWNAAYSPYGRNSYFTFSKLRIKGASGAGTDAIDIWGDYNRVIGNVFQDLLGEAWSGVVMVDNSQYTKIYGNLFDHNGFDSYKHNIYIKTHPNYVSGDKSAEYTYVGWNEFNNPYSNQNYGGTIFISKASDAGSKYTRYIWIHDNYFHDGNMEFIYTGDNTPLSDIYIYNNIFRGGNNINTGIFLAWDTTSVYLYNNLFYQIGGAGVPLVAVTGATHSYFKNNIWIPSNGQQLLSVESYYGATVSSDHDLFFNPYGTTTIPSGGGVTVTNPITGDPRFSNAASYDFHLQSGSPAIDAGTSAVSSVVMADYDGFFRPAGSGYDNGPYEYGSGGSGGGTPPSPPQNLVIQGVQ